ncbi:hypothetical protein LTSEMIN_2687, partial [Salmonella enterica subsp. enterica serovar Minnesota str. A4-603]
MVNAGDEPHFLLFQRVKINLQKKGCYELVALHIQQDRL